MHRFYLPPEACTGTSLMLEDREAHHALHVLRLREGDDVEILDGSGTRYQCRITQRDKHRLSLSVLDKNTSPAPPWRITLLTAIVKPKAFDMMVQKAAELGVTRLVPIITARVAIKTGGDRFNLDKWKWVAADAIKQCGSPWLPILEAPRKFSEFMAHGEAFDLSWVASLKSHQHPRKSIASYQSQHGKPPRNTAIWIGPEGDFTEEELSAIENTGATPISLGPLVLRADTAAIYCVSILNHELRFMEESA